MSAGEGREEANGRFVIFVSGGEEVPEVLLELPGIAAVVARDPGELIPTLERVAVQGLVWVSSPGAFDRPELDQIRALECCCPLLLAGRADRPRPGELGHVGSFDGYVDLGWSPEFIAGQLWGAVERVQSGRNMVAIQGTLLEALSESQRELVEAREMARASAAAKSRFLATVSHEIRTPLNGIIGMTLLALDGDLGDEEREHVRLAHESGQSLLAIVNDILDISKLESGKMTLERTSFDLKRTLAGALAPLGITARTKGLSLQAVVGPGVSRYVVGDGLRIKQIVTNLVGNAIKFTSEGDVSVRVDREPSSGPDALHIRVVDDGIGIPSDRVNQIFDRFSQADDSTTRKFGGTGLGLAICRELAEMMNGRVWAESEVGRGSTFHVVADLPESATADLGPLEVATLEGRRIMLASPSPFLRRALGALLGARGAEVVVASNPGEVSTAFERARWARTTFDHLLVDTASLGSDGEPLELGVVGALGDPGTQVTELATPGSSRRAEVGFAHARLEGPFFADDLYRALVGAEEPTSRRLPSAPSTIRLERARGAGLRVLVAEDNLVNQKVAARMLERAGHAVTVVGDGEQALNALERSRFDLVLMDIHMPVVDGLTAVASLREREARTGAARTSVVALTAASGEEIEELIARAEFDAVLGKPVEPARLQEILDAMRAGRP